MNENITILKSEITKKSVKFECPNCGHEFFKIRGLFIDKEGEISGIASIDTIQALTIVMCGKCEMYNVNSKDCMLNLQDYKDYMDSRKAE